jgi:hypothetical protein
MPRSTFPAYLRELAYPVLPKLASSWGSTMGAISTTLVVLALFNKPLAVKYANWEGISPWFALVPLIGFLSNTMLLAAFKKHQAMELAAAESDARLDESRRAVNAHAAAAAARIAQVGAQMPTHGEWTNALRRLRQFADAIDALFENAPKEEVRWDGWKSWVQSVDSLMEQVGQWKSAIHLPPQVRVAFEHPKPNSERADPSGPTEFVATFTLLSMFEMAIDATRVELEKEAKSFD